MGFSFGSPSSNSKNYTDILNDNRQQDNKVAADGGSSVLTSAGGALTNQAGAIVAGERSNINVTQSDKGAFDLASQIADRAFGTVASNNSASNALAGNALETTAKLAQGSPIGTDWKGLVLPIAAIAAVLGFLFLNRKGRS